GRATAVMLARAGAAVAVGYRSRKADAEETIRAIKKGSNGAGAAIQADLGDPTAARRAVTDAARAIGGLDLLVVNHGVWPPDDVPVAELSDAQWDATVRANLDSVLYVCRAALPPLPDGGKTVLEAASAGERGAPLPGA